jgi:uroporphyrinogen decarboxylase
MEVFSPFTHLLELFGYEEALMALLDVPEICHRLLAEFTEQVMAQVQVIAPCEPDAILISSAFAGAGFISRKMYQEFVVPYEKRVVAVIREHRLPSYVHTCGAIGDRLDLMEATHTQGIDTLDPPPLGTVELADAVQQIKGRMFIKGNLDPVNTLLFGPPDDVRAAARERLRIAAPGGGYILSTACSVSPAAPPANIQVLREAVETWGRYDGTLG